MYVCNTVTFEGIDAGSSSLHIWCTGWLKKK